MLACFEALECRVSLIPQNLGDMSEERDERFHQNIKSMETRYQARLDLSMMEYYCWCLKRDCKSSRVARKAERRKFMSHTDK